METSKKEKIVRSSIGALLAIFLFFSPGLRIPGLDNIADDYFSESITKAAVVYATCRVINASVSIAKESTLNLEPAGVGITLAVGQALDPIDDMTERVSDLLVTAITSLGVQKLAFEIGVSIAPRILALFLLILSILTWFENEQLSSIKKTTMSFIILIMVARLALPISALASNYIQENFLGEKISNANKELLVGSTELDKLMEFSVPEVNGVLGTIKNNASFIQRKTVEFKDAIVATVSNAGTIVEALLKLTFLYVGVFIIQVIALPIMVFWLLVKFANSLFETNFRTIVKTNFEY
ncbi:MAG: hypothetical protein ABIJ24_02700 [Nitrospinota bacterium]|nr:hypothetical protein [Nitrospinota bacterium]